MSKSKSLFEEHGENAVPVLQGMMKTNKRFPKGFKIEDKGNHYIISKGKKSMEVGLYCADDVFEALNLFG